MHVGKIEQLTSDVTFAIRSGAPIRYDWKVKFDALIAAVMELDDAQRDRILARAKALEAESHDEHTG